MTIVNESDASERYCPMSFNSPSALLKCEASKCMLWRWGDNEDLRCLGHGQNVTPGSRASGRAGAEL